MPIPLDPRKKATAVKIHVKTGAGVDITWADGHASHYEFAYLRDECPCATCNDERGKKDTFAAAAPAAGSFAPLPMFKPTARPVSAEAMGKYAIRFKWNDDHDLGIYSWKFLREVCPCAECKADNTKAER